MAVTNAVALWERLYPDLKDIFDQLYGAVADLFNGDINGPTDADLTINATGTGSIHLSADAGDVNLATTSGVVELDAGGLTMIEADSANKLGFFGAPPASRPVVPLTTPDAQDVIDALVALGLVTQSD